MFYILAIIIFFVGTFAMIMLSFKFHKNWKQDFKGKSGANAISAYFTMFAAIIGPCFSLVSSLLFISSLQQQKESIELQSKIFEQDNYDKNFNLIGNEISKFIDTLSLETEYNKYSETSKTLKSREVLNELLIYLKKGKCTRKVIKKENIPVSATIQEGENAWFTSKIGDFYTENGLYYECVERPYIECEYLEDIDKRFRALLTPMFDLLKDPKNKNSYYHKRVFASYLNKEVFEIYLTTRYKPQNIPDMDLFSEFAELIL